MASSSSTTTSTQLRQEGNDLYRKGRLTEAIEKYLAAISLDPCDAAPRRTLSSTKFELGDYEGCIRAIHDALELESDPTKQETLRIRLSKCYFNLSRSQDAKDTLNGYESDEAQLILAAIENHKANYPGTEEERRKALMETVEMPLYRPSLHEGLAEYFPQGHDTATAAIQYRDLLKRAREELPLSVSFFYGGVGDARHLYQQLHHIHAYSKEKGKPAAADKFFFAVQDLKPHMIARNVIVFRLLHDLSIAQQKERSFLLASIWYVFACDIMPPYVHARITALMRTLIDSGTDNFGIPWLRCDAKSSSEIRSVFRYWLTREPSTRFDVEYAQTQLIWGKDPSRLTRGVFKNISLKAEWDQYEASMLVFPPPQIMKEEEPELASLIEINMRKPVAERKKDMSKYARKKWKTNFTLFQEPEWYNEWYISSSSPPPGVCDSLGTVEEIWNGATPYAGKELAEDSPQLSIVDLCMPFFQSCADVLLNLDITVECRVDEVNHQLDSIRYDTCSRSDLPRTYDSIFLSNVPDYIGGHLSTVLHAIPLLKAGPQVGVSFVQSNIRVNVMCFTEGLPRTFAEYTCLPSLASAKAMLGLDRLTTKAQRDEEAEWENHVPWMSLSSANRWVLSHASETLPGKSLFIRWLTQMFFKLAMPVPKDIMNPGSRINQPLTLSTFIRLCIFLVTDRRIPAHWVGGIMDSILTGSITTYARPQIKSPLEMKEVSYHLSPSAITKSESKLHHLDVFIPELRSLLIRYFPILPFPLFTPLPPRFELVNYSLNFEIFDGTVGPTVQVLTLVFASGRNKLNGLWKDMSTGWCSEGVYVVGNIEWKVLEGKGGSHSGAKMKGMVQSWMEKSTVEAMKQAGWKAWMVRTDKWVPMSDGVLVTEMEF
ncbi:hypothetical protein K440DRAFT_599286 [Wilcoxina mikolae CBS 423.85]|nr:hypothetical protein K440DRAFT_599286 [Wilcoxina mikolae CBS 423.85]